MKIADIARIAQVSVSTVSKVVNGKDQGINPKTRKRILTVVKEYNYIPYSSLRHSQGQKRFLLGFLSTGSPQMRELLTGVQKSAREHNYGVIVCDSGGDVDSERKCLTMLCRSNVDGVLWEKTDGKSAEPEQELLNRGIPFDLIGIDYSCWGYRAAKILIEAGHSSVGCIINSNNPNARIFAEGVRRCLFENQIFFDDSKCLIEPHALGKEVFARGLTGFVCFDADTADELCHLAGMAMLRIPEELSVITVSYDSQKRFIHEASMLTPQVREFGAYICSALVGRIEQTDMPIQPFDWNRFSEEHRGVDIPLSSRRKSIVVVGSVNIDVLINVSESPQVGKTITAHSVTTMPGGKGLNQAVGITKLDGRASLIAKTGKDSDSADVRSIMDEYHINPQGLTIDEYVSTGKAYIDILSGGESSIIVYSGANNNLSEEDVARNENLFSNAAFCLVSMEIPLKTAEFAMDTAKRHNVKVILKPSTLHEISGSLLKKTDIFVPNEQEANILCPKRHGLEAKALYFFEKGAETVIVTLGAKGCYMKSAHREGYFPAVPFAAVDTTGGADAFISALSVYLNENLEMDEAIRRANCAAAFCVSRQGVLNSMVDRTTLELYMMTHIQLQPQAC